MECICVRLLIGVPCVLHESSQQKQLIDTERVYVSMHYKYFSILVVGLFLITLGAALWILNIEGLIKGPWSTILGVLFTIFGIMLAMLQWHGQMVSTALTQNTDASGQDIHLRMEQQSGALIIYTKKQFRGVTIHLFRGFDMLSAHADLATTVVERKVKGHVAFVGIFPALEPGNYTVRIKNTGGRSAHVTIYAGQMADVDWRS